MGQLFFYEVAEWFVPSWQQDVIDIIAEIAEAMNDTAKRRNPSQAQAGTRLQKMEKVQSGTSPQRELGL